MTSRDALGQWALRLRRYARGLVAGQPAAYELADDLVRVTWAHRNQIGLVTRLVDLEVGLYALLTRIHRDAVRKGIVEACRTVETGHSCAGGTIRPERSSSPAMSVDAIPRVLAALALEEREAVLLVSVEGFSYARSARILNVSRRVLVARLSRARRALSSSIDPKIETRSGKMRPTHLRLVERSEA
jgi:RNA polymerase sigma-70 factor (ECF subfamily)